MAKKNVSKKTQSDKVVIQEAKVKFVTFRVRAVIPVQQYGNIQPEIEVMAPTYEAARDFAMAKIEELWKTYAERPVNGNLPSFVGPVKVEEKIIVPKNDPKEARATAPSSSSTAVSVASAQPLTLTEVEIQLSEAGTKAKKMIDVAVTVEALSLVEQKIKDSVKVPADEKPVLYAMVLKKRKSL